MGAISALVVKQAEERRVLKTHNLKPLVIFAVLKPQAHSSVGAIAALVAEQAEARRVGSGQLAWEERERSHEAEDGSCRLGAPCLDNHDAQNPCECVWAACKECFKSSL